MRTGRRRSTRNVTRGRGAERQPRRIGRENLWRVEPHERQRRETEPRGPWEEESVRRLRKPEGAAQPGEASPVQVASPGLIRCRGAKPHESRPREGRFPAGQTL